MKSKGALGVFLLVLLLTVGLLISAGLNRTLTPVAELLTQAQEAVSSGEAERGQALLQQAKGVWEDAWHAVATVADHAPMEEIDGLFSQVEGYLQQGLYGDFRALCERLQVMLRAVTEAQSPDWWNLL